ncbi:MAG TPA: HisA/HisF-related TIM barrel protein [Acidimicrobiales bacterium]|nr:HisA/HisF-related TIM barrel protein [Acidimicrobiales bacterium]
MDLWPAIDIREGRCVRLRRGDFDDETRYGDPLEVAARYLDEGATRLHVVDLDAARAGEAANRDLVLRIARRTGLFVQAGGGVRSVAAAAALLDGGVARVVVGTAAVSGDGDLLTELLERWPGRVVVGLDYRTEHLSGALLRRELAVRGWTEGTGISLEQALDRLGRRPLAAVAVTDIARDGTGAGPDLATLGELLARSTLPILASGGIGSAADIARIARLEAAGRRVAGVIIGTALLSGTLTLAEAQRASLGLTR